MEIDGVKIIIRPVKDYRLVTVFRGGGLSPVVNDSDPQQIGAAARTIVALKPEGKRMAEIANGFIAKARVILAGHHPANMVLLRGFSEKPKFPTMTQIYKLRPVAIAGYPMYRGLAKVVGMEVLETGSTIEDEIETLKQNLDRYDFFFVHIKPTDSAGEDGDFDRKVAILEQIDEALSNLLDLKPDVIVITGDHSTPAALKGHSWHPLPVLLYSQWCRPDKVNQFSESACVAGGLGHIQATEIMPLAMANALKLNKFGA
jgi:2,3-bisphosphoglycerate-independent phosphoglycerate mutase